MGLRTFSEKPKFRVTEKDLLEFNSWIKSKDIVPRLRKNFQSDRDYENFLIDYQERTKEFDAIPKDHPDQELGNNSFIVVKVSPTTGEYYYYDVVSELHPWWDLVSKCRGGQSVPKLLEGKFVVTPQTKNITLEEVNNYIQKVGKKSGVKVYADLSVSNDPSIISKKTSGTNSHSVGDVVLDTQVPTITADWNETKPFNLSVEPWVVANCINDKADGLYIGSLLGDNIDIGNSHISIDIKSGSPQPVEVLVLLKNGKAFIYKRNQLASKNKTFSEGMQYDYRFSIVPTEVSYEMSYVIGSWMMAASVCHLYHICDQKYSGHMALDEFYTEFPKKIDALAEHYLADNEKAEFRVCVVPHECPIDYLTRLVEFTMKYSELNRDKISSPYQSQLDDIVNFTKGILYKLKRLGSGRRIFSILSNDTEG